MDFDNLFILIIIFSFIARAVGEAMKGKKGPGQPPQQRPGPQRRTGLPQQRPQRTAPQQYGERLEHASRFPAERAPAEAPAQKQSQEELAAEMIPDDLWQILTGQSRRPAQTPERLEADTDEELLADTELDAPPGWGAADLAREDREAEALRERREEVALEHGRAPEAYQPVVVSLETEIVPTPVRHAAFHAKYDTPQSVPGFQRNRGPSLARIAGEGPQALRRAVLLQEILGKPKGLE